MLHSKSLLLIYSMYSSLYLLTPYSEFILPLISLLSSSWKQIRVNERLDYSIDKGVHNFGECV